MRIFLISLLVVFLVGCKDSPAYRIDQDKRTEIFLKCMDALPAGPQSTHYNDWDDVVSECKDLAYYNAKVCYKNCEDSYYESTKTKR